MQIGDNLGSPYFFLTILSWIIFSFFIGSLPFSYILPRVFKGIDIRKVGSKNVGATNVYRNCGWFLGLSAALLDMFKGAFVFLLSSSFYPEYGFLIASFSVLGHCYSPWLKFKGGKGVSTTTGVIFIYNYKAILILLVIFIIVVFLTKIVSLSSITVTIIAPFLNFFITHDVNNSLIIGFLALFIIYRHSSNIKRILNGTEKKI